MAWQPFEVYSCDDCGKTFHTKEGWLEWLCGDDNLAYGWRIVHHRRGCMHYSDLPESCDNYLSEFVQNNAQNFLGLFLRQQDDFNIRQGLSVKYYGEFADTLFRLTMPYYEEARQYFYEERENETLPRMELLTPSYLQKVIVKYDGVERDPFTPVISSFTSLGRAADSVLKDVCAKMKK